MVAGSTVTTIAMATGVNGITTGGGKILLGGTIRMEAGTTAGEVVSFDMNLLLYVIRNIFNQQS